MQARTAGVNYAGSATYVTGSHSMKFGYHGYWWKDDRELHTNTQAPDVLAGHDGLADTVHLYEPARPAPERRVRLVDTIVVYQKPALRPRSSPHRSRGERRGH